MKRALALVLLVGCHKTRAAVADAGVDAGVVVDAGVDASVAVVQDPPSVETAPIYGAIAPMVPPAKLRAVPGEVTTLTGTFLPARPADTEAPCIHRIVLDAPIHVVDEHGKLAADERGIGRHIPIGNTEEICIGGWMAIDRPAPRETMLHLPSGSHVLMSGELSVPFVSGHPSMILLFQATVLSATPPPLSVPPGKLPDGDTVVQVTKIDENDDASFDVVFLYWGEAARAAAAARNKTLADGVSWFVINDSTQLRVKSLAGNYPQYLDDTPGGGWRSVDKKKIAAEPRPFVVRVEKGEITELREMTLR